MTEYQPSRSPRPPRPPSRSGRAGTSTTPRPMPRTRQAQIRWVVDELMRLREMDPRRYLNAVDLLKILGQVNALPRASRDSAVLSWIAASQPWNLDAIAESCVKVRP